MWVVILLCACVVRCQGRFAFYKDLHALVGTRRVFGGEVLMPRAFPAACALLDHNMVTRCTGSVLARRWVLTAAHCATPNMAYVQFTLRSGKYDIAPVHLLYTHPEYRVVEKDEGAGMDVVLLHHDVGLVRTRRDMVVAAPARAGAAGPLQAVLDHEAQAILGQEVELLGYGKSEGGGLGAALRSVRLRVAACERGRDAWRHCGCARGDARGVCSGDSGGPVMFKGRQIPIECALLVQLCRQVGVTSMGPMDCAPAALLSPRQGEPIQQEATSVFTSIRPYVALINSTMYDLDRNIQMKMIEPNAAAWCVPVRALLVSQAVYFLL